MTDDTSNPPGNPERSDFKEKSEQNKLESEKGKSDLALSTYGKLFWAICIYIVLVLITLWGNSNYFKLENAVLIALLTTTTTNIIGVFYIASRWLYYVDKELKED